MGAGYILLGADAVYVIARLGGADVGRVIAKLGELLLGHQPSPNFIENVVELGGMGLALIALGRLGRAGTGSTFVGNMVEVELKD